MQFALRNLRAIRCRRGAVNPAIHIVWTAIVLFAAAGCTFASGQLETALCSNGIAVADPAENPELIANCAALLGLKQELAGDAALNWNEQFPIDEWDGVSIAAGADEEEDAPLRVTEIRLDGRGLTGQIPAAFSALSMLEGLWLHDNRLSGEIPAELGTLANLQWLWFYDNRLSGGIPPRARPVRP